MAVLMEIILSFWAMFTGLFTTGKGPKNRSSLWSKNSYSARDPKAKPTTVRPGINLGRLLLMTPAFIRAIMESDIISVWQPRSFLDMSP